MISPEGAPASDDRTGTDRTRCDWDTMAQEVVAKRKPYIHQFSFSKQDIPASLKDLICTCLWIEWGSPDALGGKRTTCSAAGMEDMGPSPGSGRALRKKWQLTPVLLPPKNPMARGAHGYRPRGSQRAGQAPEIELQNSLRVTFWVSRGTSTGKRVVKTLR